MLGVEYHNYDGSFWRISFWDQNAGLPYRLHTNREFLLMKLKQKKLSTFIGMIPSSDLFDEIPDRLFDPLVSSGLLIKREFCEKNYHDSGKIKGLRVVLYALKGEEWRIDAYILIRGVAKKTGWNEALTRMEGNLLGYTEWQTDAFLQGASEA